MRTLIFSSFKKADIVLWSVSVVAIITAFLIFDRRGVLTLAASIIGVTSLIYSAKGNPIGQALMIVFSVIYGVISFRFNYYGEMVTYLGMTMPMAIAALISWLKNPFQGKRAEVKVGNMGMGETIFMLILAVIVTAVFFFILKAFDTVNIVPSTISVTTSFIAVYLTYKRSPFFALAYAANDMVLIFLWTMASVADNSYISVVVCFIVFLVNDLYGFINWLNMRERQK